MKTLDELVKERVGKTDLQQAELVGAEVQLVGQLTQVTTTYLACVQTESPGPLMLVAHKGELLKKQLLEYSAGDGVKMVTRFTGASDSEYYHFDLVSIVRLYTREAKEKREAEEKKRREAEQAAAKEAEERSTRNAEIANQFLVVYFAYLVPVLVFGAALIWHSLTTGESARLRWDMVTFLVPLLNWLILIVILLLSSTDRAIFFVLSVVFLALGAVLRLATVKDQSH